MMVRAFRLTLSTLGIWILASGAPERVTAAASTDHTADSFRLFASELVVDLDRVAAARPGGETLTIAVWPHPIGRTPVPDSLAQEYNDRLLAALLEAGGQRHRFVARESLRAVVADLAESTDPGESMDEVLAALAERAQADVLIVCKLRALGDDGLQISYRAVDVQNGTMLAATSHRRLAIASSEVGAAASALSLEQALDDATDTLVRRAPSLQILRLTGLRYQDSGQETPFGRYLEGRLADALVEAYENPLTGRSIVLRQAPEQADYQLAGTYWDLVEVVEVRLSLRDETGVVAVWRGQIRSASLPAKLTLRPSDPIARSQAPTRQSHSRPPGISAAMVRRAQRDLHRLGYWPGPIDGVIGPRTREAIRGYQRRHGLAVDGELTPVLAARLDQSRPQVLAKQTPAVNGQGPALDSYRQAGVTPGPVQSPVIVPRGDVVSGGRYCREYAKNVTIGGRLQSSYGTVCRQPDGSWIFAGR